MKVIEFLFFYRNNLEVEISLPLMIILDYYDDPHYEIEEIKGLFCRLM